MNAKTLRKELKKNSKGIRKTFENYSKKIQKEIEKNLKCIPNKFDLMYILLLLRKTSYKCLTTPKKKIIRLSTTQTKRNSLCSNIINNCTYTHFNTCGIYI